MAESTALIHHQFYPNHARDRELRRDFGKRVSPAVFFSLTEPFVEK